MSDYQILDVMQGSQEWLALRKSKITATDIAVIMGLSPWKTKTQLYQEKKSDENNNFLSPAMQRAIDMEPFARNLYCIENGVELFPAVLVKDWTMASLDGFNESLGIILEIKCPGEKDHAIAANGKIPEYYMPQLQWQMYVTGFKQASYFSFNGFSGVEIVVKRDDEMISRMIQEAKEFYDQLISHTPPEPKNDDYFERSDDEWEKEAIWHKELLSKQKEIEGMLEESREKLISLASGRNTRGCGMSVCSYIRSGNVDYSKVPQLQGVDLTPYRKPSSKSWRISIDTAKQQEKYG